MRGLRARFVRWRLTLLTFQVPESKSEDRARASERARGKDDRCSERVREGESASERRRECE